MQTAKFVPLARSAALSARTVAAHGASEVPVRNAVSLSALKLRIRATNNVAKITNVMKLVASSKLKAVEDALSKGRAFGEAMLNAVALKDKTPVEMEREKAIAAAAASGQKAVIDEEGALGVFDDEKKHLVVCITTDKGLCGSVNSSLTRALRKELDFVAGNKRSVRVITLGDKGRSQIAKEYTPLMARAIDAYLDRDPTFPMAAAVASKVISEPYEVLTLWYNHYENQIKFHNVYKKMPRLTGGAVPASLKGYEIEPAPEVETLAALEEYAVASVMYYALLETTACETSQRVTAMDNASTNAKDMVDRFKLIYNRARQAKITTELTEIISGAESLNAETTSD